MRDIVYYYYYYNYYYYFSLLLFFLVAIYLCGWLRTRLPASQPASQQGNTTTSRPQTPRQQTVSLLL